MSYQVIVRGADGQTISGGSYGYRTREGAETVAKAIRNTIETRQWVMTVTVEEEEGHGRATG